jgi:uncharacterized protein (TIGR03435 family)
MHVVGWVLVHFVWQGAVVALAAALALRFCRRQAASVRYVIACGAMTTMLSGAVATAALVNPAGEGREAAGVSSQSRLKSSGDVLLPVEMRNIPASADARSGAPVEAVLPWIVSAWMFGVTLLLARTCARWWRVRCLHRVALSSMPSTWQAAVNRIASRLGLRRVIRVVELPHIDVPLVVGCLRPIVVLPIAAISQLHVAQVEAILAHELAHVRRHDYLVNLMQTLAETLLFYHPAVWWVSARIRDEREHCCDDVAVAVCGDPVAYAAALAELEAGRGRDVSLAAAAAGGSLLNRVRRILRVEVSDDSRSSAWVIGLAVVAVVGGVTLNVIAQTTAPNEPPMKFEVAAVRENTAGDGKMLMQRLPGGRISVVNVPLGVLLRDAYRLQDSQLIGAPDWIFSARYDITAKAEQEFPSSMPADALNPVHLMMRSLLEERFKLAVHRETRELPIYALVVSRSDGRLGPELKVSSADCAAMQARGREPAAPPPPKPGERPICGIRMGFGEIAGSGFALSVFANAISPTVQRIVVDRTGLSGNYDWYVRWTPERLPQRPPGTPADQPFRMNGLEIDPNGPSIFTAVQEQLGLKLEAARGPVEVLVIDHIERPTPD